MKIGRPAVIVCLSLLFAFTALAQAEFKGGQPALDAFLQGHIIYPEYSRRNCIAATVQVRFDVDKDGVISNIKTFDGPGIDLDDEAVRVVKMTNGKWLISNSTAGSTLILPVKFTPDYARCANVNVNRNQAIAAYRARQELENAVTNYYTNKYLGKADTSREAEIITLKKQLGFDDELIDDLLEQAETKRKQGDAEGACTTLTFIRNIGSNRANDLLAKYCKN